MRKWITRTARVVLVAAAFSAAGTGIASADSTGFGQPASAQQTSVWDSILSRAVGPIKYVCNDLAAPSSRINTTVCGGLPQDDDGAAPEAMNQSAPADRPAEQPAEEAPGADQQNAAPQQQPASPDSSSEGLGALFGSGGPLGFLKGLGLGG
jgi:hypothetical protein